jgi:ABC-type ATPase with predicted acetyltransferase domain
MKRFSVSKQFDVNVPISDRVSMVCRMFGVGIDRLKKSRTTHKCAIEVEEGDIVYITGPSGAGKSVLLRELEKCVPVEERINIDDIELPSEKAAIDCIGFGRTSRTPACDLQGQAGRTKAGSTIEALQMLGYAGLSDVFCILTAPANLSEGQQYRFRLACALAAGKKAVFADEFCSSLDRITAAVIAYNVRRFAKRNKVTFFLASSHEDILADLQPDVLVVKNFTGPAEVTYKKLRIKN